MHTTITKNKVLRHIKKRLKCVKNKFGYKIIDLKNNIKKKKKKKSSKNVLWNIYYLYIISDVQVHEIEQIPRKIGSKVRFINTVHKSKSCQRHFPTERVCIIFTKDWQLNNRKSFVLGYHFSWDALYNTCITLSQNE